MIKFIPAALLAFLISIRFYSFGQEANDSIEFNYFFAQQNLGEDKFIDLLTRDKIDSCMLFFSPSVINKYTADSLKMELMKLNNYFLNYPTREVSIELDESKPGLPANEHLHDVCYELIGLFKFRDKSATVAYYFALTYSDEEPMEIIKYYESKDLNDGTSFGEFDLK